ncbi:MAG: DeoR/GlpR transcriptional regulator [Sebaldella sp.]|nr:DeoR/GlpR transcriptional regulator [Sebaldella sp.]
MLEIERHEMILKKLEETGKLSYENIENFLNVSIATIRRDVEKLSKKDLLNKVNGGIVSKKRINFELEVAEKFEENIEEKKKIAKKAAKLVKKGDFIYLDAGTTTYYMIDYLKDKNISVVTNGLMHLDKLLLNNIKTIIVGGEVKPVTKAVAGIEALKNIEKYRFDKSFIGVNGVSIEYGFMTPDVNEALLKEKVIEISNKAYILADQKKFNELSSVKFADIKKCKIITSELKDEVYKNYTIEEEEK